MTFDYRDFGILWFFELGCFLGRNIDLGGSFPRHDSKFGQFLECKHFFGSPKLFWNFSEFFRFFILAILKKISFFYFFCMGYLQVINGSAKEKKHQYQTLYQNWNRTPVYLELALSASYHFRSEFNFSLDHRAYLIFVIFFTRAKFLEDKIYTEKRQFFALNL